MTPLAGLLKGEIAAKGAVTVARYMELALAHPDFGYYQSADPFGAAGDFITAPEISQMFGELIGIWCAVVWRQIGAPERLNLVELGPGRGTLMADALRAAARAPEFRAAIHLHLVETGKGLRARQKETIGEAHPDIAPRWHDGIESLPGGPAIFIANEFFDALPIRQFQKTPEGWRERLIGVTDKGGFRFVLSPPLAAPPPIEKELWDAEAEAVAEVSAASLAIASALGEKVAGPGGAALIIDYGHESPGLGDTLQAVKNHAFADPLAAPGEVDLTAHVDFAAISAAAGLGGAAVFGPLAQGIFLNRLGIEARAAALIEGAAAEKESEKAGEIQSALARLTNAEQMGTLFKVLAIMPAAAAPPPGF
jgi:NADH dehydrogenase [ubiquinone] 1 alpha subcomplex assembly factor 7